MIYCVETQLPPIRIAKDHYVANLEFVGEGEAESGSQAIQLAKKLGLSRWPIVYTDKSLEIALLLAEAVS